MLISLKVKFLILTDSIDREEERKMMRERRKNYNDEIISLFVTFRKTEAASV